MDNVKMFVRNKEDITQEDAEILVEEGEILVKKNKIKNNKLKDISQTSYVNTHKASHTGENPLACNNKCYNVFSKASV